VRVCIHTYIHAGQPWDPYENLPLDYQRISQFKSVMASRLRARAETRGGVPPGSFVTLWLRVPLAFADKALEEPASPDTLQARPTVFFVVYREPTLFFFYLEEPASAVALQARPTASLRAYAPVCP
jgi:hypothetical protein